MKQRYLTHFSPVRRLMYSCLVVQVLATFPAQADYTWLGTNGGDTDAGVRRTIFNGDAASLFSELNWEDLSNPGSRPLDNTVNNSSQSPAGNNATLVIGNGGVAGGTNGAGLSTAHCRTNGFALTVTGENSGIKTAYTSTNGCMIQNDGTPGGDQSTLTIGNGAYVTSNQLQDIAATLTGPGARLFLASNNATLIGLENSTVNLVPAGGAYPEIFWVNNTVANVTAALAAQPAVTLNGAALVWGSSPLEVESGDNVVFTNRSGVSFASFKQLPGNAGTTNGLSVRAIIPVTPQYWDINGSTAGAGGEDPLDEFAPHAPSGSWNDSTANWTNTATGDSATAPWTEGGVASFAAANALTGYYAVSVTGTRNVSGLIVENGDLDLTGGTIAFSSGELLVSNGAFVSLESAVTGKPTLRVEGTSALTLLADQTFGGLLGTGTLNAGTFNLTLDLAEESTFWGNLSGSEIVTKKGQGELKLVRSQGGLSGELNIEAGKLTIARIQGNTGALDNASLIRVRAGATLDTTAKPSTVASTQTLTGGGTIATRDKLSYTGTNYATQTVTTTAGLTILGIVEPGDGLGTMAVASGTTSFAAGSILRLEIDDLVPQKCDLLALDGPLKITTGATIELVATGTPTQAVYELIRYTGAAPLAAFTVTNLPVGYQLQMARGGNTVALVKVSGFDEWATAKGIAGASFTADGNDRDGIANGVEYALGFDPLAFNSLPAPVAVGGGFTLTLPKGSQAAADSQIGYFFETSTDLSQWTKVAPTSQDANSFSFLLQTVEPAKFVRARIEQIP